MMNTSKGTSVVLVSFEFKKENLKKTYIAKGLSFTSRETRDKVTTTDI